MPLVLGFAVLIGAALLLTHGIVPDASFADILQGKAGDIFRGTDTANPTAAAAGGATSSTAPDAASVNAATGASGAKGVATFDGKPVALWIIPILKYAQAHGWTGTVTSGYRTDAQQTAIYDSGTRPAAVPRSLGGSGSNHEGDQFPAGAVDVTDASQLSAILAASPFGHLLVWAGSKDPVHFSFPHAGGY